MHIVRPNVSRSGTPGSPGTACVLVLVLAACAKPDHGASDRLGDTAKATARAPSAYVTQIPAWPADTGSSADRSAAVPARLRAKAPSCGGTTPVVAADSVGQFYPGQPLANLFGACAHLLQLWRWDDGKYVPAVALKLGDALLLLDASGVNSDAVVTRVAVLEGARTADGIGPGSLLADVQRVYGVPTWRRDQCAVGAAFESRPGLVIHVAIPESGGDAWTCEDIRRFAAGSDFTRFPRGATVASISAELDAGP